MKPYNKYKAKKFLKSLWWNYLVYIALFAVDEISRRLGGMHLDPYVLGLISVFLSRVTKMINVSIQERKELE